MNLSINKITDTDGLFLHAAAVQGDNGVTLLLGHSGSGKTTLSNMLGSHFNILKEDKVFVQCVDDQWLVDADRCHDTDFFAAPLNNRQSTETAVAGTTYPLHAIIRIFGAEETTLNRLTPIKMCEYLMDAVFEIGLQRTTRDIGDEQRLFSQVAQIARQYPGWVMRFSLNLPEILRLLQKNNIHGKKRTNNIHRGGFNEKKDQVSETRMY